MKHEDGILKLISQFSLSDMHQKNFVTFDLSKDKTEMLIRFTSFKYYRNSGDEDFVFIKRNSENEPLFLAVEIMKKKT